MFVLALDLDRSTFLMKETVLFWEFASTLNDFVGSAREAINGLFEGWFDKFTGDGFLAYWMLEDAEHDEYHDNFVRCMGHAVHMARVARDLYTEHVVDRFRHNSRNIPSGLGVRIGIDAGPAYLVEIAGDLTIVGPPVVGAVRMESSAASGEIIANTTSAVR
jgi:class 3 adenylate cyclase